MSITSEFIFKFQNIQGITIGERKEQLFQLLKEYAALKEDEAALSDLVRNLKPATYLQHVLRIKILLYFKRTAELFEILTGGNEVLIKQLWKERWFFQHLMQLNSPDFFVNELFKHLSYVNRMNFLRNVVHYTQDERKIDALYDSVLLKYGPVNAKEVLAGCSLSKILNTIKQHTFKFNNKQVLFLHKNKKSYFNVLLNSEYSGQIFDFYDYNEKAFFIISGQDSDFFIETFKQNRCPNIGKSLTKKLLIKERQYVVNKASDLHQNLHRRTLCHNLHSDFKRFFFDTWPKSYKNFRIYTCMSFLKYYPRFKYFEIIQEGLNVVYGKQFSDCPELIDETILQNTKNSDIRNSLVEIKVRYSKDDYTLAQYFSFDKSIEILKKKINMADGVTTRENLIKALVNTCKVNDDVNALLEVLKYFCFRHRNDDPSIRSSFLSEINALFDLSELSEEHWESILELLKWSKVKDDNFWLDAEISVKYIKFLHKNSANEDKIKEVSISSFKDIMRRSLDFNKYLKDVPILEKYLIDLYANKAQNILSEIDHNFALFLRILNWNQRHPDDQIDFCKYPVIEDAVLEKFKNRSYYEFTSYINQIIKREICDEKFAEKVENILWDDFSKNFNVGIVEYYLRRRPLKILEHLDVFIETITNKYCEDLLTTWRLVKNYDHLDFPAKIIVYLKKNKKQTMELGMLMNPVEYLKIMRAPSREKLDLNDDVETESYRPVEELLRYAKFLNYTPALQVIVEFCKGDYLHTALAPLYFYFFHVPEEYLDSQLEILSDRAVSVRKHSVKLACSVSPIQTVYRIIKKMTENEKNQSALNHLFAKTFKYFLVVQSEELWSLLQIQIKSIDIIESPAFREVCTIKKIPDKFKLLYLSFMWEILDRAENNGGDVADLKENLMRSLDCEVIRKLPYEFCSNLIKQKLFRHGNENDKAIISLAINCMKYGQSNDKILEDIFSVMAEFHKNYVKNSDFNVSRKNCKYFDRFISDLYFNFSYEKNLDYTIIDSFYTNWKRLFDPIEHIESFTKVTLLAELKKLETLDTYTMKIAQLFNIFVKDFGIIGVIASFIDALNHTLPDHVFNTDNWNEKKYKLAAKLIELDNSVDVKLLAIHLTPQEFPESTELKTMLFNFMERLRECNDNSVRINLNLFIASLDD